MKVNCLVSGILFLVITFSSASMAFAKDLQSNEEPTQTQQESNEGGFIGPVVNEEPVNNGDVVQVYADAAALAKCGPPPNKDLATVSFYAPKFKSPAHSYVRTETVDKASYMCMQTSLPGYRANGGYGWVAMAPNSNVGYTSDGQAYYLGTPDGQYLRCHNHILAIYTFQEVNESYNMGGTTPVQVNANANATATVTTKPACEPGDWVEEIVTINEKPYQIFNNGCTKTPPRAIEEKVAKKKGWSLTKKVVVVGVVGAGIVAGIWGLAKIFSHKCNSGCNHVTPGKTNPVIGGVYVPPVRPRVITGFNGDASLPITGSSNNNNNSTSTPQQKVVPKNGQATRNGETIKTVVL